MTTLNFFTNRKKPQKGPTKITSTQWVARLRGKKNKEFEIDFNTDSTEEEAKIILPQDTCAKLDEAKKKRVGCVVIEEDKVFKHLRTEYHLFPSDEMCIKVFAGTEEMNEYELKQHILFLGVKIKFPAFWDTNQTYACELFEIPSTEQEFKDVKDTLVETLPNAVVVTIQRIQNIYLQARYYSELCFLSNKNDGYCNQNYLFHGTRGTNPKEIISSQEGFDFRLSSKTNLWGPGIYFAEEASYADGFAFKTGTNNKQLILASVALGVYFDYEKLCNPTLTTPPMNIETKKYYDSVSGITRNSRVYTIFNSYQACPRYLITYQLADSLTEQ